MATFTSTRTSPTDIAVRLHEVEAVLKGVLDKKSTENPDLTEVKAALDRIYRIVLFGAGTEGFGWNGNPQGDLIFNGTNQRSLFSAVFGVDGFGLTWAQYLTGVSHSSAVRLTYGNDTNIAQYLDAHGLSLATATVDSPDMLTAFDGKSLASKIYGDSTVADEWKTSPSVIGAVFGSQVPTSFTPSFWSAVFGIRVPQFTTPSLVDAIFGGELPGLTDEALITRIGTLESRMTAVENRLSHAGL